MAVASIAMMSAMSTFAEDATEAATESSKSGGGAGAGLLMTFLPLVIMFALLYFIAIKPQKKRDKGSRICSRALK